MDHLARVRAGEIAPTHRAGSRNVDIFAAIGGTAWTVAFFVIALSVIVFVHEYGHYIVGRWSGIHAEVFSVGLRAGPVSRRDRRGHAVADRGDSASAAM